MDNNDLVKDARLTLSVLVVDDDIDYAKSVRAFYKANGFGAVGIASSYDEAIAEFRNFDLVVIDVQLGDRNGFDLASEILQAQPDKWVIVMSGFPHQVESASSRDLPLLETLHKPIDDEPNKRVRFLATNDDLALRKAARAAAIESVTASLSLAVDYESESERASAQVALAEARAEFARHFLPASRRRRRNTGQISARRSAVLRISTSLNRLSYVPSDKFELHYPTAGLLQRVIDSVSALETSAFDVTDFVSLDRALTASGLGPVGGDVSELLGSVRPASGSSDGSSASEAKHPEAG